MNHLSSKLLSTLLALLLTVSSVTTFSRGVKAEEGTDTGSNPGVTWEKIDTDTSKLYQGAAEDVDDSEEPALTGTVRVSIVLDKPGALEAGYTTDKASMKKTQAYRNKLETEQNKIAKKISKEALDGEKLDVVWHLTLATNIISANVDAADIAAIRDVQGVKDVVVETKYLPEESEEGTADPNMTTATEMTQTQYAWSSGYTGAGSLVAIVDTGLDINHQSFNPEAFDYAIGRDEYEKGEKIDLLTKDEVKAVWPSLNASQRYSGNVDGVYKNEKVPYGFNYVDSDLDVTHDNDTEGEHGSHVAGIIAANRYIYSEDADGSVSLKNALTTVRVQGNAPDAQVLVMKVFGKGGGAYDSDYMAAVEDAIVIGADSVNLSLGSSAPGYTTNSTYQNLLDSLASTDSGIVWANSAGNAYSWADNTTLGYLYSDGVNYQTTGSPATYSNTLSVASVDNKGFTGAFLTVADRNIFYTESAYSNAPMTTIAGDYEYLYINSPGTDAEFAAVKDELQGKVAICNRGSTSFYQKGNAAVANGAIATIIANNQPGTINMNLTGYTGTQPCISITRADGDYIIENSETNTLADGTVYYTGKIHVDGSVAVEDSDPDYYVMSDFSSWGTTSDLSLKPEITAPGGNIYSLNGSHGGDGANKGVHDAYENMSGTSMASPQVAGIAATLAQYAREEGVFETAKKFGFTKRQVLQSLIMSTATPLKAEDSDSYYPVFQQGAGLINLEGAINSTVLIKMDKTEVNGTVRKDITTVANDGKVKAELGDDPDRSGKYAVEFTMYNLTDKDRSYTLDADFFTQDIFTYYQVDNNGRQVTDANGNPLTTTYLDSLTTPLNATVKWYLDGSDEPYEFDLSGYNFDEDAEGKYTVEDAQAVLDYVTGVRETIGDQDKADLDEDGDIDTYDAYLALKLANQGTTVVPASGSIKVRAEITLNDIDKYDDKGAYVEGYINATEKESADGALGVKHSIPVIGYYGSWTDPKMTDVGTRIEYNLSKTETRFPYMAASSQGANAKNNQSFTVQYAGSSTRNYFGGNPFVDEEYKPERNAISSDTTVATFQYALIRIAAGSRFYVADAEGNPIAKTVRYGGSSYGAYYNQSSAAWSGASTSTTINTTVPGQDGDKESLVFEIAPEFYGPVGGGASIRWDDLGEGAKTKVEFTVDNTAPVIENVIATKSDDGVIVSIKASDNQYIATAQVWDEAGWTASNGTALKTWGSTDEDHAEGVRDEEEYGVSLPADSSDHLLVVLGDYAGNTTAYQINLNKEELANNATITLDKTSVELVKNSSDTVSATVGPWGAAQDVVWSSADESVATVDQNGTITGVSVGTTTVTAAVAASPSTTATVDVNVIEISKDLNAAVWDESGKVHFSSFNTAKLPEYKADADASADIMAITYGGADNSTLYAASLTSSDGSQLYTVNPDTFELTPVGSPSEIPFFDLASDVAEQKLFTVYGGYVLVVDPTTGQYEGGLDFSSRIQGDALVGITLAAINKYSFVDEYYYVLVDNAGYAYRFEVDDYSHGFLSSWGVRYYSPSQLGKIGDAIDTDHFNSLYSDGTNLIWSRFSAGENDVDIVYVRNAIRGSSISLSNAQSFNLGSFDEGVWPVAGLYELGNPTPYASVTSTTSTVPTEEEASKNEVFKVDVVKKQAAGTLNQVSGTSHVTKESEIKKPVREDDGNSSNVIVLEAERGVEVNEGVKAAHNGLYTVTYDPAVLTLVSVTPEVRLNSYVAEEGKVTFGYATLEGQTEGAPVAELKFSTKTPGVNGTVTVTQTEAENEKFESTQTYTVSEYVLDDVLRVAGANRYQTALDAADLLKEVKGLAKFNTVVVANGEDYQDALAGAYLATENEAPLLLAKDNESVVKLVNEYLAENLSADGKVYVLGGEEDVPSTVGADLEGVSVVRVGTADKTETDLAILKEAGVTGGEILVSSSKTYADSLTASATGKPILLVGDELTESQKEYLAGLTDAQFTILGGSSAVSGDVGEALSAYGKVTRVSGKNRFETATAIADKYFPEAKRVVFAYSENYPDGLTGGILANALGAPVLYGRDYEGVLATETYTQAKGWKKGVVLGGSGLISDNTVRKYLSLTEDEPIVHYGE